MKHIRRAILPVEFELKAFDMNGYTVENNTKVRDLVSIAHAIGSSADMPPLQGMTLDLAAGAQR